MEILDKITNIVLLEEKVGKILEQISYLEIVEIVVVDGVVTKPSDYIKVLNKKIDELESKRKEIIDELLQLDIEYFYQAYEEIAHAPMDKFKMMKLLTIFDLIERKNTEMEGLKLLKLHKKKL